MPDPSAWEGQNCCRSMPASPTSSKAGCTPGRHTHTERTYTLCTPCIYICTWLATQITEGHSEHSINADSTSSLILLLSLSEQDGGLLVRISIYLSIYLSTQIYIYIYVPGLKHPVHPVARVRIPLWRGIKGIKEREIRYVGWAVMTSVNLGAWHGMRQLG